MDMKQRAVERTKAYGGEGKHRSDIDMSLEFFCFTMSQCLCEYNNDITGQDKAD